MREKRWLFLFLVLNSFLVFSLPVNANPMQPTMTRVFITQDGIPVDDTVDFSLDCYGTFRGGFQPRGDFLATHGITKILNFSGDDTYIFSYSATCKPYEDCYSFNADRPWMIDISSCDLSGTYKGQPFRVRNISIEPMLSSILWIAHSADHKESSAITEQVYQQCYDQKRKNDNACDTFINQSASDGTRFTPAYWQCRNDSTRGLSSCYRDNGKSLNNTVARSSEVYYEFWFDIPSGNSTEAMSVFSAASRGIPESPVEILYCSILNFFGVSC